MKRIFITRTGYDNLKHELIYLWKEKRPIVTKKVTEAAANGDRSENADYQYNKKMLREIDRRVMYITKRLEVVTVVDYAPQQDGYVYFGAFVKIENDSGENLSFQIVGPDEIYGHNDRVSIDSPMASALIKKQIGDEAVVKTPKGPVSWYVTDITYDPLGFVKF